MSYNICKSLGISNCTGSRGDFVPSHVTHVELDEDKLSVTNGSVTVQLLPKEFDLLAYLQQHTGRVLTRPQLLDAVWPNQDPIDRTVDDHVYRLRKKLELLHSRHGGIVIETVRGKGYRLSP
ncbi:winged helix-turn-helix transcriptional regulator [Alicyclobacillus curvatus]|nr:winged helix-turn-helix transcriptional regulator [Alicyclobacillus curvatus]